MMSKKYYLTPEIRKNVFGSEDVRQADTEKKEKLETVLQEYGFSKTEIQGKLDHPAPNQKVV